MLSSLPWSVFLLLSGSSCSCTEGVSIDNDRASLEGRPGLSPRFDLVETPLVVMLGVDDAGRSLCFLGPLPVLLCQKCVGIEGTGGTFSVVCGVVADFSRS